MTAADKLNFLRRSGTAQQSATKEFPKFAKLLASKYPKAQAELEELDRQLEEWRKSQSVPVV